MFIQTLLIPKDYGGLRKEFFLQLIREAKIKYFDDGLIQHLEEDYFEIGLLFVSNILLF